MTLLPVESFVFLLKNFMKLKSSRAGISILALVLTTVFSCQPSVKKEPQAKRNKTEKINPSRETPLSSAFKKYWYAGKAEVTSYKLEQARYGEMRDGHAVLVFVTEDFLPEEQVKADYPGANNVSVLKLNTIKKFNTGIYPYSIMQSTFFPLKENKHALKVSASIQEWCGQTYMQLNNKADFHVILHSYFQSEGDQSEHLKKSILENELWTKLRVDPDSLPTGKLKIIPSFEYLRLKHGALKAYEAETSLSQGTYRIKYPELQRELAIHFNPEFPYEIISWEETFPDNGKMLTTKATQLKTLKTAYWHENSNQFEVLRDTLKIN